MRFGPLLAASATVTLLLPATAIAESTDDLAVQVKQLAAENAELRARVAKLEATVERSEQHASTTTSQNAATNHNTGASIETIATPSNPVETGPGMQAKGGPWTGPYLILSAGPERSRSEGFFLGTQPTRNNLSGTLGGVGLGGDIQTGRLVVGARLTGEYDHTSSHQDAYNNYNCIVGPNAGDFSFATTKIQLACRSSEGWTGEFTGRLGYTFLDNRMLAYLSGGVVISRLSVSYSYGAFPYPGEPLPSYQHAYGSRTMEGATIGAGVEYRLDRAFSLGAEYELRDFGSKSFYSSFRYSDAQGVRLVSGDQFVGPQPQDRSDQLLRAFITFRPAN